MRGCDVTVTEPICPAELLKSEPFQGDHVISAGDPFADSDVTKLLPELIIG